MTELSIGAIWAAGRQIEARIAPPPRTTSIGYAVTCEDCGHDVIEYQTSHVLQGAGEGGLFRNSYHSEPHHCRP